jgi:Tfp pilus assembly protein PilX
MLLLIVMTILALYMFRSNGVQQLIAGNVREKQRAIQTAEAAEQYAEMWLSTPGNVMGNSVSCTGLIAWPNVPTVCSNPLSTSTPSVTTVPWTLSGTELGFVYYPGPAGGTGTGDLTVNTAGGANAYYQGPRFYISLLSSSSRQALYRIDAWNYAGTPNTATVVESNYLVTCTACGVTGP